MAVRTRVAGTYREAVARTRVAGTYREAIVRTKVAGTWRKVSADPVQDFTVTVSPSQAYGQRSGAGSVTTNSVTASASGGSGNFTYQWQRTGGDSRITATSGTTRSTAFTATLNDAEIATADFLVTVDDTDTGEVRFASVRVVCEARVGTGSN